MSGERLTAERLKAIRDGGVASNHASAVYDELLPHIDAQQAEIDRLEAQLAAYREAVEGALEFGERYLTEHERELCRLGDDTEDAAREHDRCMRIEGARLGRDMAGFILGRWDCEREDCHNHDELQALKRRIRDAGLS